MSQIHLLAYVHQPNQGGINMAKEFWGKLQKDMQKGYKESVSFLKSKTEKITEESKRHWDNADLLSADSANSKTVRDKLRSRSRYEALEANSFAKGIVLTLANDVIGTGPRLNMLTNNPSFNQRFEKQFHELDMLHLHWMQLFLHWPYY